MDNFEGFHTEVVTSGRIPYEILLLHAVDAVRQGIVSSEDGGLASLLGLYAVLPEKIRKQLNGFEEQIEKHLTLRIVMKRTVHKVKAFNPPSTHLENKLVDGGYLGGMAQAEEVTDSKGHVTFVPVSNYKLDKEFVTTKGAQRYFTFRTLRKIIDLLDTAGILWRSRTELTGSDN